MNIFMQYQRLTRKAGIGLSAATIAWCCFSSCNKPQKLSEKAPVTVKEVMSCGPYNSMRYMKNTGNSIAQTASTPNKKK